MYLRYFGFEDYPFAVTPDPAFLYLSESHREALAHLLYGAGEHGGFVSLIGEVGTGKTTLIRAVVDSELADLDIALCWNPQLEVREFVATICDELGVAGARNPKASLKTLTDRLNAHLLEAHAANRRTVLIVDEAQNLSRDVLEQLRLLTNLETHRHKLLRIILVGQPELSDLLARHDLRQLAQRITARFVLKPLGLAETRAYVQHRLECANGPQHLFSSGATIALRAVTGGVPRLINMVCERALMGAYAHGTSTIGAWMVLRAALECLPPRYSRLFRRGWRLALPTGLLAGVAAIVLLAWLPDIPSTNAAEQGGVGDGQGDTALTHPPAEEEDTVSTKSPDAEAQAGDSASKTAEQDTSRAGDAASQGSVKSAPTAESATASDGQSGQGATVEADQSVNASEAATPNEADVDGDDKRASGNARPSQPADFASLLPTGNAEMSQLLRLWGVFGADVQRRCDKLRVGDLRCLDDAPDLDVVARYNRPALIDLDVNDGTQTVLLTALDDAKATIVGSDGTRDIDRGRLESHWAGRARIVWRADAGVRLIRPGSVGSAVVWLRNRLDRIDGQNPEARAGKPSPVYDAALGKRLREFQAASGLDDDGLAGPRTQMMLNGSVATPGTPSLRAVGES